VLVTSKIVGGVSASLSRAFTLNIVEDYPLLIERVGLKAKLAIYNIKAIGVALIASKDVIARDRAVYERELERPESV